MIRISDELLVLKAIQLINCKYIRTKRVKQVIIEDLEVSAISIRSIREIIKQWHFIEERKRCGRIVYYIDEFNNIDRMIIERENDEKTI